MSDIPADGTEVVCKRGMPGVPAGTPAVVRHESPGGHSNLASGLVWLELAERIQWSFGQSEQAGYWAGRGEYDLAEADQ